MKCNNLISIILLLVSNNWNLVGIARVLANEGISVADASTKTSGGPELFDNDVFASHLLMGDEQIALAADVSINLVFLPKLIDFQRVPIGEPQSQVITVFNRHTNQSVYLGSILGNVPDFYTSYFSDSKVVIPPEGNATFNIVFLPRKLGETVGQLMIHTSFGLVKYEVKGEGIECPYRLTPLVNLKAPLNATITPEIKMFNPHHLPLQILEVYSSGGAFQLELPSGKQEGPSALWEIPAYTTKSVIRIKFYGNTPGNHTAYVRIKVAVNQSTLGDQMLVVPIEIEVLERTGLYASTPFIDFGILWSSKSERRNISLLNSGKQVDIKSWWVDSLDTDVLDSIKLSRFNESDDRLLVVETDWSHVPQSKHINGRIVINYTSSEYGDAAYSIPFTGKLAVGSMAYDTQTLSFLGDNIDNVAGRTFSVTNNFSTVLLITSVSIEDDLQDHFRLIGFLPTIIQPQTKVDLFALQPLNGSISTAFVRIQTNVTVYRVPVHWYNGRLRRVVPLEASYYDGNNPDEGAINFGTLPVSVGHQVLIAFVNPNPVKVKVSDFRGRVPGCSFSVALRGCGALTMDPLFLCDEIEPNQWVVYEISVMSGTVGSYNGKFTIKTEINGLAMEEIVTPIKLTTAMGRLELNKDLLHFTDCYPGKLCSLNLSAYSTFMKKMRVEGISVETDGITYVFSVDDYPEIAPNVVTDIGRLYFNPKELCKNDCYSSFEILSNKSAAQWMSTLNNFQAYSTLDANWLTYRQNLFAKTKKLLKSISFRLSTTQVRRYEFNASVNFIWPKFLPSNINFPTLQVDQEAVKFITIANPTDHLLLVHYVLHDTSIHGDQIYTPSSVSKECSNCSLSTENVFSFLRDENEVFIQDIPPHSYYKIGIRFAANEPGTYSTVLYLRNNLTVVESVWITAKAVVPQFKFGNRKSGSPTPLIFEVTDKHLKACEKPQSGSEPFVSIKRTFTAKNHGEVPITVYGIFIEDTQCESYGFKVLNCNPFELSANESRKVDIIFYPDWNLSRVTRMLYLHTSAGYEANFTLLGTVPPYALEMCSKAIVRPPWESTYRRISATVLTIAFFLVMLTAFLDSDRVLRDHLQNISRDRGPVQPPLDLRQIATSLQQETNQLNASLQQQQNAIQNSKATPVTRRKNHNKFSDVVKKHMDNNGGSNGDLSAKQVINTRRRNQPTETAVEKSTRRGAQRNQQQLKAETVVQQKSKQKEIPVEVEDSSSTTTESSFNSDDNRSSPKAEQTTPPPTEKNRQKLKASNGVSPVNNTSTPNVNNVKKVKNGNAETGTKVSRKENSITPDSQAEQTKINGNFTNGGNELTIDNFVNESGPTPKYLGKTPGRERSKANSNNRNSNNKTSQIKGTAFNFDSNISNHNSVNHNNKNNHVSFLPSASIWSNNSASFSDVVTQTLPDLLKPVSASLDQRKNSLGHGMEQLVTRRSLNDNYGKRMMSKPKDDMDEMKYKRNSAELGPIGTRRQSPINATANQWDSAMMNVLQQPIPSSYSSLPRSRFLESFQQCDQVAEQVALSSNLNTAGVDPAALLSRVSFLNDNQSLFLAMQLQQQQQQLQQQQQQQLRQQQHEQAQQQQQQQQAYLDSSWSAPVPPTSSNSSMWTPMGYSRPSIYQQQQQQQQQQPIQPQMSAVGSWPVRPPPGLAMSGGSTSAGSSGMNYNGGNPGELNSNDTMATLGSNNGQEQMPAYDPFKTMSYLWQGGNEPWNSYSDTNGKKQQ